MKTSLILISLFFLLILISTCGHMTADAPDSVIYPMNIGQQWHYIGIIDRSEDYPEPIGGEYGIEDTFYVISEVVGNVLLRDSIETIAMGASGAEEPDDLSYIHYYQTTDKGLYIIAYENAGGHIIHPKNSKPALISFKSYRFANIFELSEFMEQALPLNKSLADTVIYEDPPVLTLKYPLTIGSQWTYRYDYHPWRIDKRIIGREDIHLDIGTFNCYHIQWLYDFDHDGHWDEDIWIDDFLSDKGIIKRRFSFIGVNYSDEQGNVLGSFDMTQEYTLTALNF